MVDVTLIAGDAETVVQVYDPILPIEEISAGTVGLYGLSPQFVAGTFKSLGASGAGTTTFLNSSSNGSLLITDLILSADKVQSGTVEVRITDGVNSEPMVKVIVTDAPVNLAAGIAGRFQTWRDARIDVVVANAVTWNLTLGYAKMKSGLEFSDWNARR